MQIGIDEVGRGAWAGPVVAAAVTLRQPIEGLRDSKLLSKARREKLAALIQQKATAIGIGWVWPKQVDEMGLTGAISLAMSDALTQINLSYSQIIIDGAYNFLSDNPKAIAVVKADTTIPSVSAASIIAKVARDQYMAKISKAHPHYFFEKNVGYGTKLHQNALVAHGLCELHRRSYKPIQKFIM